MKRLISRSLTLAALSAAAVLAVGAPAQAAQINGFNSGILSGNQFANLVQVPINVCGNAVAIFGSASAACVGGAVASGSGGPSAAFWRNFSRTWS